MASLIGDAHFLQEQEPSPELKEMKERERRFAMVEHALGKLSLEERDLILNLLNGRKQ